MRKAKRSVNNRLPAMTKLPVLPGVAFTLSRARLGRKLYQPLSDFNLSDPNCHIMRPTYNTLHDPNLNKYYHQKQIHDKLKKQNFITEDDKVVCSLKEYNTYKHYLDMVKTDHEKSYNKIMKAHMLRMVQLQETGHIPNNVSLEEIRAYLLKEGAQKLTQLQSTIGSRTRGSHNLLGLLYDPKRQIEMEWVSNEQSRLIQMEKEVKHNLNKEKYLKDIKEKYKRKKMCIMEQKQAIQIRKMEEDVKNLQEFQRLMETTFKPKKLLEEIIERLAPVQPAGPLTQTKTGKRSVSLLGKSSKEVRPMPHRRPNLDCLAPLQRRPSLDGLEPLHCMSKTGSEKDIKTEQVQVGASNSHTGTKGELGTAASLGFLKRKSKAPGAPIGKQQARRNIRNVSKGLQLPVLRTSKDIEKQTIPDRAQLKSVILDHLGSSPVRKQLMESARYEVKQSIPRFKPAAKALSARIANDMLKCISQADNPNENSCRLCGGNPIKPNAEVDDPEQEEQFASGEDLNTYVTTLITNVLEEVKEQVIMMIVEDSPTQFRVASAKASQVAKDVVSHIFKDVRDLLDEGNIEEFAQDNNAEECTSGPSDHQPTAMIASEIADLENAPSSLSKIPVCNLLFELAIPELQGERVEGLNTSEAVRNEILIFEKAPSPTLETPILEPVISCTSNRMVSSPDISEVAEHDFGTCKSKASGIAFSSSQETNTRAMLECNEQIIGTGNTHPGNSITDSSVNTKGVVSWPILHHKVNKANEATPNTTLPNLYRIVFDGVMDQFGTELFKDRLAQSVKNELRQSLSMPEFGWLNLQNDNCLERKMLEELSRECRGQSYCNVAEDGKEEFSRVECAAAQLIQKVFQDVKSMCVDKIKRDSPKRCLSPKVSQTAINAVSSLLGEMETTLMASALQSQAMVKADMKEITAETAGKHPVTLMDSAKVDLIAEDLVEYVIDMCCEMILASKLILDDHPEEGPSTVTAPGPVQSCQSGSDESNTESKAHSVKNDKHEVKPILIQDATFTSAVKNNTDENHVVRATYVFDSKRGSPRRKSHQDIRSTSFSNLHVILVDEVLDHIGSEPFKESLAQSVRKEVRRPVLLPQFGLLNLECEDCLEKEIIEDCLEKEIINTLKSVYQKLSQDKGSQLDENASDTEDANVSDTSKLAKELIINVLDVVKTKLVYMIKQDSPNWMISPKASQTAIIAVNKMFGGMETSVKASNTQFIPAVARKYPDLNNVTYLLAQTDSTKVFKGYPGNWMSSQKIEYIVSILMETVYNNLLDEDAVLRRNAWTKSSQEDLQKGINLRTGFPVDFMPSKICLSMSHLNALNNPEKIGDAVHRSESLDSLSLIADPNFSTKEAKMTQLTSYVAASSSHWPVSDYSVPLVNTSSVPDILIDEQAKTMSSTDEERGRSKCPVPVLLNSDKSVLSDTDLVSSPEVKPKVRLPGPPVRVPGHSSSSAHIHKVHRNPVNFLTEAMRLTSSSSSEGGSPIPEETQRQRMVDSSEEESVFKKTRGHK